MQRIGIIGGSGLYNLDGIKIKEEVNLDTPFGKPSDKFILAESNGREVIFLPRHGRNHSISPSGINYRANIYGMKKLNAGWIISVSACGSLKEDLRPLEFVIPDQFADRTNQGRKNTFFDDGIVAHVTFANPVCKNLTEKLLEAAKSNSVKTHYGGTYLNMEGPQFSTLAESNLYRKWGMDIIGMTNLVEAKLAREAEICYATLAAITDYDCWRDSEEAVSVDVIIENLKKNVDNAKKILKQVISLISEERECECEDALKYAIITRPEAISVQTKEKLGIIIDKYIK